MSSCRCDRLGRGVDPRRARGHGQVQTFWRNHVSSPPSRWPQRPARASVPAPGTGVDVTAAGVVRRLLGSLSDVRAFFHQQLTVPLYFISPTPIQALGIYRWIRNFFLPDLLRLFRGRTFAREAAHEKTRTKTRCA